MQIILDKPSLSFRKAPVNLQTKQVFIYTNELTKVSRTGIFTYLMEKNKLSIMNPELSTNRMTNHEKAELYNSLYLRTTDNKQNLVLDILLEKDEDLVKYNFNFPIFLQIKTATFENTINSLTTRFNIRANFQILNKIGEGTYAEIYLARQNGTDFIRAIKIINKERCQRLGDISYINNQFDVLTQVDSYWNTHLHYAFEDDKNVYFVMEYSPFGDIYQQMKHSFSEISLEVKNIYFIQVAFAICRLHLKGFIYRDLKPENVLIDYNGNAKLCDFGYSVKTEPGKLHYQICGSYEYLPPQMITKQGYNHSHDLYCLGLLFYEMLTDSNPFKGITSKNLEQILRKKVDFQIYGVPDSTIDIIQKLMQKDPRKRLGWSSSFDVLKHPFFSENAELVIKVIKNERNFPRDVQNIKIKNYQKRQEEQIKQGILDTRKKTKKVLPFNYNSLFVDFNITEKMGPKMAFGDNKNKGKEQIRTPFQSHLPS